MKFEMFSPQDTALADFKMLRRLSRANLIQRWQCGSASFFQRAENDGFLKPPLRGGRPGYSWQSVWNFEGSQPPLGLEAAYQADLITAVDLAHFCPVKESTILREAALGKIPCRRIGRFIRFVPLEAATWLSRWD
jgi:hypothetical protein